VGGGDKLVVPCGEVVFSSEVVVVPVSGDNDDVRSEHVHHCLEVSW
jgi:hypothetical protein